MHVRVCASMRAVMQYECMQVACMHTCMYVCVSVSLSVRLFACRSVCQFAFIIIYVCMDGMFC